MNLKAKTRRTDKLDVNRQAQPINDKYWPWSKPIKPRGMCNLRLEEIFPNDELQKSKRMVGTLNLGKPGGGAPYIIKTKEDPLLRFQWSKDLRQAIDNNFRYKKNPGEQQEYKKQLDKLVREKKHFTEQEKKQSLIQERASFIKTPPWGKPGPGGTLWRHPKNIGLNFMKSMGWSDKRTLNNIQNDWNHHKNGAIHENLQRLNLKTRNHSTLKNKENYKNYVNIKPYKLSPLLECKGNGVDLVNVIARKRYFPLVPLSTTDITEDKKHHANYLNLRNDVYLRELTKQINFKCEEIKKMKEDEMRKVQKHFVTWESFWGRPGHGAPGLVIKKGDIDRMLFPQMIPTGVA